jgi:tRNA threonylcarbamoyladenosine biosynthesis protein TsaE
VILTKSPEDTVLLGERIARSLKPNDVVAITGELGAGKTTLIQGVAKGLGINNWITSPTFTLINEFTGKLNLYHVDLYRIDSVADAEDIAIEEYFNKGGVTVIEWAEKIGPILPAGTVEIKISIVSDNERSLEIKGLSI